jgi:hypothetical protein
MNSGADSQEPQEHRGGAPGAEPVLERRGEVVRLLPIAVLVASGDRYFRSAAAMLLSRRGCTVLSAVDEHEARDHAVLAAVDVLVIELARPDRLTETASAVAEQVDEAARETGRRVAPIGVVVVGEPEQLAGRLEAGAGAELPVLDKWGPFERLYQAIVERDSARRLPPTSAPAPPGAPRLASAPAPRSC